MEECVYITYLGQKFLFANHVGLRGEELLQNLKRSSAMMLEAPREEVYSQIALLETEVCDIFR